MKTQRLRARDMFKQVAPMVGQSGVCYTTDEGIAQILEFLNLACWELSDRLDSEGTMFEWYVPVDKGCFALPQDCREVRQISLNGIPMRMRSEFYIGKIASGPGVEGCCGPYECRDLGDFYIPQYLPKTDGIQIALVALDESDAGKEVLIEVTDRSGVPRRETITLLPDAQPALMKSVAYDVTYFMKPKTVGVVSLQLHYDNGQRFYFASYLPDTTEGLFRRKQLPQRWWGCNIARLFGKVRYVPIDSPDQILPFNNPVAVGWACAAIAAFQRRNQEEYGQLIITAMERVRAQMQDADSAGRVKQMNLRTDFANPSWAGGRQCWV
jgi:hypothetical protein